MEFESTEQMQMVYETLNNIDAAIIRLQERTVQIHTVDDFLLSPFGMEKLTLKSLLLFLHRTLSDFLGQSVLVRVRPLLISPEVL